VTALFLFHLILALSLALIFSLFFQNENEKESDEFIFLSNSKDHPDQAMRVSGYSAYHLQKFKEGLVACFHNRMGM